MTSRSINERLQLQYYLNLVGFFFRNLITEALEALEALVVPVLKSGKDKSCKLFEKMVNKRLIYTLVEN
jgi:hypothetical protein